MISRRQFLQFAAVAAGQRAGKPRGSEFVFARLRYESGDWDYNPKVAANVLDSIVQYTSIPVYKEEVVIAAGSAELPSFPFVFMTGHKLVRFSAAERDNLRRFADAGGLLFSDDCNHDVNGLYARSLEQEMAATFPGEPPLSLANTTSASASRAIARAAPASALRKRSREVSAMMPPRCDALTKQGQRRRLNQLLSLLR